LEGAGRFPAPLRVLLKSAASIIEQDGIEQGDYLRLFFGRDVLDEICNGLTFLACFALQSEEMVEERPFMAA